MSQPARAVFLSYASQDAQAAKRVSDALREAGLEVWFDQSELRGGDAWDASIRKQIKECALIVPIISANTDARSEGYFRLEWKLAVERSHLMADDRPFLLPVVIDDTPEASARVPDRFRERQWTRLEHGQTPPAFGEHVAQLLAGAVSASAVPGESRAAVTSRHKGRFAAMVISVAVIASVIAVGIWNGTPRGVPVATSTPEGASVSATNVPVADRKSVAVLPFENLSGRGEDSYLGDGLQEEVLNALARLSEFKVISRTSVMEYRGNTRNVREIGQRLGVGTILEGSIRRDGNTLRLTVQLIDAHDDRHLFAANYDRDMTHVLELQSAVARQVAGALSATLSRAERGELDRVATNNGDAYDQYLRALAVFRNETPEDETGVAESRRLLEEAVAFDPDYADAQALLSQAHTWTFFATRAAVDGAAAKQAFERAMAIDAQLPEARLARGLYLMYVADDLDGALVDLASVVQLRPNSATAHSALGFALRRGARFDEALEHQIRARDLDPLNQAYAGSAYLTLLGLRRFPEAIEHMQLMAKRFPSEGEPYVARARIESYLQHTVEPLRVAWRDHGKQIVPAWQKLMEAEIAQAEGRYLDAVRLWEGIATNPNPMERAMRIGFLHHAAGNASSAEKSFHAAERYADEWMKSEPGRVDVENLALAQSMLGQHAAALATIEALQAEQPESRDATNGPQHSFIRSVILVRAGRSEEGYAEVTRLLRVPFGAPIGDFMFLSDPMRLLLKDDPHYDELLNHPPRL
ncbi:MAG TPA: TIR domain-containing protein [Rudaea sp.]|jgi:TolB-like protein|nr:TIR domain-containing protein [Rudaea sp.]